MAWLVLSMTIAVVLGLFVVAIVAVPARRSGRYVLTPRGEKAIRRADERARAARQKAARHVPGAGANHGED